MKWGEGLNNQHEVGGEGRWREINDGVEDCRRGGAVQVKIGGKGGRRKTTRDKVSGFATSDGDARSTLAW
jgi:hypothetical protein